VLRHRLMERADIAECVNIIRTHPVIGLRYGSLVGSLEGVLERVLDLQAVQGAVLEESTVSRRTICFVGLSVFVTDSFVQEIKTPPLFWVGPELLRRGLEGNFPALTDRQLREANSRGGLNLLVWEGCVKEGFERRGEVFQALMKAYFTYHRGFLLKEQIGSQIEDVRRAEWLINTGGLFWDPERRCYANVSGKSPEELIRMPHIVGITREIEQDRYGSWAGDLFSYQKPRCCFSRSEQELLIHALEGLTDEELSRKIHVSLPVVKKTWASIYRRASTYLVGVIENENTPESKMKRGKEKRRRLLSYLQEHPEELRPVSRKILLSV